MRKHLLLALLMSAASTIWALDIDYRVSARGGMIMPDDKVDVTVGRKGEWIGPVWGGEVAMTFRPDWQSLREWDHARIGAALGYWWLSDDDKLGHLISPYTYIEIPLARTTHFELGLRPGIGLAFATKTYRNTVPEGHLYKDLTDANRSIGSVTNLYLPEALYAEVAFSPEWRMLMAAGWYHASNGSTRQPNSGYNIFAGELGLRYRPEGNARERYIRNTPHKKWELELAATGGAREVYYRDQLHFGCATLEAAAYWRAHNIFRLGGGVDVFYDGAYTEHDTKFGKTDLTGATQADCWRVGVSLQPEFVIGHMTAGVHAGVYLRDPVKRMEGNGDKGIFYPYDLMKAGSAGNPDGWLYTQIVLRYHLPWHLMIEGQMKAHLTKVEFVSVGIGFSL